jgi:hypothetical protein
MYDIMSRNKIAKLRRELQSMYAGAANVKLDALRSIAKKCGREKADQGNEPTYINMYLPKSNPLSIPGHTKLNRITVRSIIDALTADLDAIEDMMENNASRK